MHVQAFLSYCDAQSFGGGGFGAYLVAWCGRMGRGVTDLNAVRGRAATRKAAVEGNLTFIREERRRLKWQAFETH